MARKHFLLPVLLLLFILALATPLRVEAGRSAQTVPTAGPRNTPDSGQTDPGGGGSAPTAAAPLATRTFTATPITPTATGTVTQTTPQAAATQQPAENQSATETPPPAVTDTAPAAQPTATFTQPAPADIATEATQVAGAATNNPLDNALCAPLGLLLLVLAAVLVTWWARRRNQKSA